MERLYSKMMSSKATSYIVPVLMGLFYILMLAFGIYTFGPVIDLTSYHVRMGTYVVVFVAGAICFKELSDMHKELVNAMSDPNVETAAFRYRFVFRNIRKSIAWFLLFAMLCVLINMPSIVAFFEATI